MSQDIADMPGIDAAMERFNAMVLADGHQPTANANGSDATSASARTESNASGGQPKGWTPSDSTATRETKADAQPTAGRQTGRSALPNHGEAQNSVSSSEASVKEDASTITDTPAAAASPQAPTASHTDSSKRQGNEDGKKRGNEDGRSKIEDGKRTGSPSSNLHPPSSPQEPSSPEKTRYAKAQERLEKTWESVNKRKGELDAQAQQLEHQRLALERDQAQFEAVRRQADQPSATPEQALQAAQLRRRDADALSMQAKRAEDAGRFDESQRLNKQAEKAESLAEEMADYAEQLRKNPPASMQQRQQQFEEDYHAVTRSKKIKVPTRS